MEPCNLNKLSRSVTTLQRNFDCPICLELLQDPVRTTVCGHTFCRKCISVVLKSNNKKKPCPLCNASLTHRSITEDSITQTFLQLTLELITAINLDTGINISEYKSDILSTNEAVENSEDYFKIKKSDIKNKRNYVTQRNKNEEQVVKSKLRIDGNDCNDITKKCHAHVTLVDCFSKGNKKNLEDVVTFKKPFVKSIKIVENGISGEEDYFENNLIVQNESTVVNNDCKTSVKDSSYESSFNNPHDVVVNDVENSSLRRDRHNDDDDNLTYDTLHQSLGTKDINNVNIRDDNGDKESSCEANIPFNLIEDVSNLERIKKQSFSIPFVLYGTLHVERRKEAVEDCVKERKTEEDFENYSFKVERIKKITLFDSDISEGMPAAGKRSFGLEKCKIPDSGAKAEPISKLEFHPQPMERSCTSVMKGKQFVSNQSCKELDIFHCDEEQFLDENIVNGFDSDKSIDVLNSSNEIPMNLAVSQADDVAEEYCAVQQLNAVKLLNSSSVEASKRDVQETHVDSESRSIVVDSVELEQDINNGNDCSQVNNTIIEGSDDEEIDDNISQTPPAKTVNSSGFNLGGLLSQRPPLHNMTKGFITDSESNEIPSSLNDMPFNFKIMNNAMNLIPSAGFTTDGIQTANEPIPNVCEASNLSIIPYSCDIEANAIAVSKTEVDLNEVRIINDSRKSNGTNTINKCDSNISFVHSRLTDSQVEELKLFAICFNADITNMIEEGRTTHVIIKPESNNKAPLTFKYLKGVGLRLWVLSVDWISDSLKAGKMLPEVNYLVLDSYGEPGPLRCKVLNCEAPLKNFIVLPDPPFSSTTEQQVKELILLCGGAICPIRKLADMNYKPQFPRISLVDAETEPPIEYWLKKYHLITLNIEWLLQVVGRYNLVKINPFMMVNYPRQLLQNLFIPDEIIGEDDEDVTMNE